MNTMFLKKRIPTILGIFLLLVGITAGVYLVELGPQSLTTRAEPEITPRDVRITNITDSSFTVSWKTDAATVGLVRYGTAKQQLTLSILDIRDDEASDERSYTTHYITVSKLLPQTTYYFELISGASGSVFQDEDTPYMIITGTTLEALTETDTAYGTIYHPDLTPAEGSLVYLSLPQSTLISSLAGASGTWAIPLSYARSSDLANYAEYSDSDIIQLEIIGPNGSQSLVTTTAGQDSPVDDIVLGEMYDFTSTATAPLPTSSESQFSLAPFDQTIPQPGEVTVTNIEDKEPVYTQKPEIIGDGPPGLMLEITIESNIPYSDQVTVGDDGQWTWTPPSNLEPGDHMLTLRWIDESGIARVLTRSFVVYAQEESSQPSFEASPSATITPTSTPTPTPTSGQGGQVSPTPTPTKLPTPTPSKAPTPTPIASPSAMATDPALPVPGAGYVSILIVLLGLSSMVVGLLILLRKEHLR